MQGVSVWPFCGCGEGWEVCHLGVESEARVAQSGMFNQRLMKEVARVWTLVMANFVLPSNRSLVYFIKDSVHLLEDLLGGKGLNCLRVCYNGLA